MNMNLGYSLAVEKLCGMKTAREGPGHPRHHLRDEPHRQSHLVAMGTYGLDLGTVSARFSTPSANARHILDLFEEVCGARLTYSYITIGGVA